MYSFTAQPKAPASPHTASQSPWLVEIAVVSRLLNGVGECACTEIKPTPLAER